jgi:hypothetical protein
MAPGLGGGTYQDALDRGYHLGAVCSTDNWGDMPGHYGNGRMACMAGELTRASLWDAFTSRRVYGVTGDRILIDFRINDAPMGSIIRSRGPRRIVVRVTGCDALDRIEILRDGRVLATHCHQGTWQFPERGSSRFKIRIEAGWGPRPGELDLPDRHWHGHLKLDKGRIISWEPCWISGGQSAPVLSDGDADFHLISGGKTVAQPHQNANIFEFEADVTARLNLNLNGQSVSETLEELARSSRGLWYREEAIRTLQEQAGIPPGDPERDDVYYLTGYKAKIHRLVPEAGYSAVFEIEDDEPLRGESNYRVRVEQRNAQRAWSSPIWVSP